MVRVCFIGAGNIAECMISGMLRGGFSADNIIAAHRSQKRLDYLSGRYSIQAVADNAAGAKQADVTIVSVKPHDIQSALESIKQVMADTGGLLVSVVAGVSISRLSKFVDKSSIIRAMPNTPTSVGAGLTALYAENVVGDLAINKVESLFRYVGGVLLLDDESKMHKFTALSASGVGFVFRIMSSFYKVAESMGFSAEEARFIVAETFLGASKLALSTGDPFVDMCEKVASRGGTTFAGLSKMEAIDELIDMAIISAAKRSQELGNEM